MNSYVVEISNRIYKNTHPKNWELKYPQIDDVGESWNEKERLMIYLFCVASMDEGNIWALVAQKFNS